MPSLTLHECPLYWYIATVCTQYSYLSITFNEANGSGGGISLYHSTFTQQVYGNIVNISCNKAKNNGGGIYATNSLIIILHYSTEPYCSTNFQQNSIIFPKTLHKKEVDCTWTQLPNYVYEKLGTYYQNPHKVKMSTSICFASNIVLYRAAIYVADETYSGGWVTRLT